VNLTAVSLFAGVEGFGLAMERNGIKVVADVEIDKAARSVLERRFPKSQHFNDIKEVTGEQLRNAGFVPDRGILTGGFPCQDLSVAGKRAGLVGRRSGLYWEIVRLIDELSPKWLVLENVPGLLSAGHYDDCADITCSCCAPGRDFGTVLGSLVERGYGVAYRILDAQFFGVPQRRRRVFIVGCLGDDGRTPFEVLALAQGVSGDSQTGATEGQEIAGTLAGGSGERGWRNDLDGHGAYVVRAIKHDEFVPDDIASTLRSRDHKQGTVDVVLAHTLTAEYDASEDGTGRGIPLVAHTLTSGADGRAGRRQEDDSNLVPVLLTMREGKDGGGKGPLVSEDVSLTLATGNGQVLIQPFNKVVRSGARDADGELPAEVWRSESVAPTLNAFDQGDVRATTLVAEATAVRRLTPTECERLQGFPDGWTDVNDQKDSARYRQMGNAVCVPVVEWIMKRLGASS
jgi:DNA (cytosine-5)-methyltransferase 1